MAFDVLSFVIGQKAAGESSGEDSVIKEYSRYEGSFKATAEQMTVEHICGEMPDILIVFLEGIPQANTIFIGVAYNQATMEKFGGGYLNQITAVAQSGGSMEAKGNVGMEYSSAGTGYEEYGGIRNVTDKTFMIGGTSFGLQTDSYYQYIALCGLA